MDTIKTGALIIEKRKQLGLTQAQLAEKLHVSDKTVSKWETGKGFPDIGIVEELCAVLNVSAYELLKGEKASDKKDEEVFSDGIEIFRRRFKQKTILSFMTGFLVSLVLFAAVFIHLNAPIYYEDPANVRIDELSDGRLIFSADKDAQGCTIERVSSEGNNEIFISCYKTVLGSLKKEKNEKIYLLGEKETVDAVWFYPAPSGDVLIYGKAEGGVVTLPRLVYNYWIVLSGAFCILSGLLYQILKGRHIADLILRYALLPGLCLLISMLIVLAGNLSKIYDAVYYFSGIVILTLLLYLLCLLLLERRKNRKKD
ncbi:MAG: helix-turn-helix domain-containing protein [Erysipelotrichaceae bacterium]|nr:helix-turn-helix domain-containing protein [Erysipelotrichaceae bacterium]